MSQPKKNVWQRHPHWDDRVDLLGHLLLRRGPLLWVQRRICDWYDRRLGVTKEEMHRR